MGQLELEWVTIEIGALSLRLHRQIKQVFDPARDSQSRTRLLMSIATSRVGS